MAIKLNAREQLVFDYIFDKEGLEATDREICEHFRGEITSTRILTLLDSIFQKGWTLKRWPNWHRVRADQLTDKDFSAKAKKEVGTEIHEG